MADEEGCLNCDDHTFPWAMHLKPDQVADINGLLASSEIRQSSPEDVYARPDSGLISEAHERAGIPPTVTPEDTPLRESVSATHYYMNRDGNLRAAPVRPLGTRWAEGTHYVGKDSATETFTQTAPPIQYDINEDKVVEGNSVGSRPATSFSELLFFEGQVADDPEARFPDKKYDDWIRDLIEDDHRGIPEELKGDKDGAVQVEKKGDEKPRDVQRRKEKGDTNPKRKCGGSVTYVIALNEIIADTADQATQRRIYDWAYALKASDAGKAINCEIDACKGNGTKTRCVTKRWGMLGNWGTVRNNNGKVIPRVGWVKVGFTCICEQPVEGPITGPSDESEDE